MEDLGCWSRALNTNKACLKCGKQSDNMNATDADILLFSFIGDALALGSHWIYDQDDINSRLGRVTSYHAPISSYHPAKSAGEFTHYGDQTLLLLRSVAVDGLFDVGRFANRWRTFWEDPENLSYRDGATRQTLEQLQAGVSPGSAGSDSRDIAGAARIGPLFLLQWEDEDALIEAVRGETAFTHASDEVVEAAEFFCRVVLDVRSGTDVPGALESVMALKTWQALPKTWLTAAKKSAVSEAGDSAALGTHGLSCDTAQSFPGICHLLFRYPGDPVTALVENATAGGDNAARGMILGLVYGVRFPVTLLPQAWLSGLAARDEITDLIHQFS